MVVTSIPQRRRPAASAVKLSSPDRETGLGEKKPASGERLETIETVREGMASMKRGEGRPAEVVFDELEKELRCEGVA